MLTVKTIIRPSKIEGLGLFAAQEIKKGEVIWEFTPKFDILYTEEEFECIPEEAKSAVRKYSYFSPAFNLWVLCGDDARFMNHSDSPNTEETENETIAARHIKAGEEITCDYSSFDGKFPELSDFTP